MRPGSDFWDSAPVNAAFFALFTLVAWITAAFLFVLLERVPLTRGASPITQPAFLVSLLPWLAGSVFWVKLRKRAKLGKTDKDTASFCYSVILILVCGAYVAMQLIGILLLQVLSRAR